MHSNFIGYFLAIAFISVWWAIAFWPSLKNSQTSIFPSVTVENITLDERLSPLTRKELVEALGGNYSLMGHLISMWDRDAQMLEYWKVPEINRLPNEELLIAIEIVNQLRYSSSDNLRSSLRATKIEDDNGQWFALDRKYKKLLPQTYATASFVLALNGCQNITAIPKGVRKLQALFPSLDLSVIPWNCDGLQGERVSEVPIDLAFVADYTDPAILETLIHQGTEIFTVKKLNSIEEICNSILKVGHMIDKAPEAIVLSTFIKAAFMSIDNRIALLKYKGGLTSNTALVYYCGQWYWPSQSSLSIELLSRIGMSACLLEDGYSNFTGLKPLSLEQLMYANPSYLIVACDASTCSIPLPTSAMSQLEACRENKIQFVEADLQQSISQHIVLAYYDLYISLVKLRNPCNVSF